MEPDSVNQRSRPTWQRARQLELEGDKTMKTLAAGKATRTGRRQDDEDLGSLVILGMLGIFLKFRTFY
jgi:hypothetical protein